MEEERDHMMGTLRAWGLLQKSTWGELSELCVDKCGFDWNL